MRRPALIVLLVLAAGGARAEEFYQVADGRYQAVLGDCEGCHTAPGGRPFAGGLMLQTPFGPQSVPNITPDRATGIGAWSEADFEGALRHGRAPGGKRLYPSMPYPSYARMNDQDMAALWAYMKTLTPVRHAVAPVALRFPFNLRGLVAAWNWLYFRNPGFTPVQAKSAAWNRGAYIVTGAGHCGACHTAKTLLGGDRAASLAGGALAGWTAPEITGAAPRGVGGWSVGDIAAYLRTGWNAHAAATGPMKDVVEDSTSRITEADARDIAIYLKDQPGASVPGAAAPAASVMAAGQGLYEIDCMGCHGRNGKGQRLIFPPLAGNPAVIQPDAGNMVRIVLEGAQAAATKQTPTAPAMPSFAWKLKDGQVADLLTYVRNSWGNKAPAVTAASVAKARNALTSSP